MILKYSPSALGLILALFAMMLFSFNDGIYKYLISRITIEQAAMLGFGISLIPLLIYSKIRRISVKPVRKRNWAVYSFLFLIEQMAFLYALRHLPIAELFVVILAAPVFVLMLSGTVLNEYLSRKEWMAVMFGFAGALIVMCYSSSQAGMLKSGIADKSIFFAWAAAIANVLINGSKILYLRKYCRDENSFSLSLGSSFIAALGFGMQVSWTDFSLPFELWFWCLLSGLLSAAGCIAYVKAFTLSKAALISSTQYSQIFWAVMMGVFLFGEKVTFTSFTGIILILISGYLLYTKKPLDY